MEVKSDGTFSVLLVKLATPPLPPQTKLNLEMSAFLAITLLGWGGGGEWADDGIPGTCSQEEWND